MNSLQSESPKHSETWKTYIFSHNLCSPISAQLPTSSVWLRFVVVLFPTCPFLCAARCKESVFCTRSDAALIVYYRPLWRTWGFCVPVIEIPGSPTCFFHKNRLPVKGRHHFFLCPVIQMHMQRCKNGLVHRSAQGRSRRNLLGHSQTHSRLQFLEAPADNLAGIIVSSCLWLIAHCYGQVLMDWFIEHTLLEVIRILKISHFCLEMTRMKIVV